ncbi:MAG: hypothetical protein L0H53_01700 [Candidatus Nitrosocosmicus sp.]|nr:hypothetical protein [Candidatus Nitrosocosmicus sp.]MDN5867583.1 hypothetical protein [Candidatus Nitrosocosmicus sp.]
MLITDPNYARDLVLSSIAYPTISTLKDGKKRATWRLIKISLILTIPISDILFFYPVKYYHYSDLVIQQVL